MSWREYVQGMSGSCGRSDGLASGSDRSVRDVFVIALRDRDLT